MPNPNLPPKKKNIQKEKLSHLTCISPRAPDARRLRRRGGEVIARLWRVVPAHPSLLSLCILLSPFFCDQRE